MVRRLNAERTNLDNQLSHRSGELQADLRPIGLDQVQAAIPQGAALVELFRYRPFNPNAAKPADPWDNSRYVAYVLHPRGDATFADLGEAAPIEAAVQKVRAAFSDPDLNHDAKPVARSLDALVMQPIRKLLGDTRSVFLSPDGALNLVPFAALVDEKGRYLVERYSFTYLASGRDLLRKKASASPGQRPLVLADPAFDLVPANGPAGKEDTRRGLRSVDMSRIRFSPLPSTAEEAHAIQKRLPGAQVLLGAQSTEEAIKAARGPRILHIATHGFFLSDQADTMDSAVASRRESMAGSDPKLAVTIQRENPLLRSGLGLAGANLRASGRRDDGILTALEVSNLNLSGTRLVVLSACETGIGKASPGEGVYGLRRSFAIAGAETQVMSLWKVDTGVTREMMLAYYAKLEHGAGRSEAMRQVQLEMLAQNDRAHPNLWASFIVSGNPAALDGRFVAPEVLKVPPGPRGCACEAAGSGGDPRSANALSLAALAMLAAAGRSRRRKGATDPARRGPQALVTPDAPPRLAAYSNRAEP